MKIEAAVAALTVTAVETFASVMGVATADGNGNGGQNRVATKVSCNKEGGGNGGKSDGNEGGGRAMAMATTWVMATAMRLAGDKEGKCKGGTFNSDGDEDRWRWQQPPLKPFQRWQCGMAMAVADNNRNCRGRQQSTSGTGGSGRSSDSGRASGNRCSAAGMASRGAVE